MGLGSVSLRQLGEFAWRWMVLGARPDVESFVGDLPVRRGYCGWAPLPPGCGVSAGVGLTWAGSGVSVGFGFGYSATDYCWTPHQLFHLAELFGLGVYGAGVHQIYNGSTVVNNYVVGNNNTIINNGSTPTISPLIHGTRFERFSFSDTSSPNLAGSLAGTRGRRAIPQLAVYRPPVGASTTTTPPGSSGIPGPRHEVRPSVRQHLVPGTTVGPSRSLGVRPMVNQPDRLPAPNPRTPAVAPTSQNVGAGLEFRHRGPESFPSRHDPLSHGIQWSILGSPREFSQPGAVPGGYVGAGRLEPRKAPVSSDLLPGEAPSFQRPVASRPGMPSETGEIRTPSGYQQSPVSLVDPALKRRLRDAVVPDDAFCRFPNPPCPVQCRPRVSAEESEGGNPSRRRGRHSLPVPDRASRICFR